MIEPDAPLTFPSAYLLEVCTRILAAAGAPPAFARVVAAELVDANLCGHDSHGVIRLPEYVADIELGDLAPAAEPEVVRAGRAATVLDAHWGFGQVAVHRAAAVGRDLAERHGVGGVTVRRSNHIGRLGGYVERLAGEGLVALLLANLLGRQGIVVPWGGRQARLGTNPIAVGLPAADGQTVVLDMATSVVAEGKVRVHRNRGELAPDGWLLDHEGRPTQDPWVLYRQPYGGLLPFGGVGGYKGFGLGLVIELLAGALSGSGCIGIDGPHPGNGVLLLVVRVEHFVPLAEFRQEVAALIAFLRSTPPLPPWTEVVLPGEPERREAERRRREGVPVEPTTWAQIEDCGRRCGVDPLPCP